ncbi:hypothetical protein U1Q18_003896 [Sarracenia purpurea var. burkii]
MITKEGGGGRATAGRGGDGGAAIFAEQISLRRPKFGTLLRSEPTIQINNQDESHEIDYNYSFISRRNSDDASVGSSPKSSDAASTPPPFMSPWSEPSPYSYNNSPWTRTSPLISFDDYNKSFSKLGLIGSLVREEGHIYSLAASGDLLYTGSESNNIRVWKNLKEYSGFKSTSGLVKAIVISGEKVFTGHQDGKIRVWKFSPKNSRKPYKRFGSLPTTKDFIKSSLNPKSYVEVRRRRNVPWIRHFDAVSCLSLDGERGLLYSASWDKTFKVWRLSDSKCLESVDAHDDAVNSVAAGFQGLVFTGSADGTVKVWRRELLGRTPKHILVQTLLKQDYAVTAVAVTTVSSATIYCGSSDGLVNFWEREKQLVHRGVLRGHKLAVLCLATSGNLVFSGSADKSICVWRRAKDGDHTCLSVLTGHCGPVKCIAVEDDPESSSEGDRRWIAYSGSLDKSVKVWRVTEHVTDFKDFHHV